MSKNCVMVVFLLTFFLPTTISNAESTFMVGIKEIKFLDSDLYPDNGYKAVETEDVNCTNIFMKSDGETLNAEEIKKINKKTIKRIVIGILVYLLPYLLDILFHLFGLYDISRCTIGT